MTVKAIDHIYVECRSFERTAAFWQGLGFKLAETWGEGGHRAGALVCGAARVVLAEAEAGDPERPTVFLAIDDPLGMSEKLRVAKHVEVATPLEDTHWGTRWIRVRDPEGNVFALEARSR
ncbi:VOC family protein [bacterium]|nr:VOC family protein [bacterium]